MAWSLGEDSYDWSHIRQMATELQKIHSVSEIPIPAVSSMSQPSGAGLASVEQSASSGDTTAIQTDPVASAPSEAISEIENASNSVHVDKPKQSLAGHFDYPSDTDSPVDSSIPSDPNRSLRPDTIANSFPEVQVTPPMSMAAATSVAPLYDFTPDAGYVNPNYHGPVATSHV